MATRYVNTASSAGGDGTTNGTSGSTRAYASLSAWEAARQADLVTAADGEEVLCCGTAADTTEVTVDGWTTNATYYISIKGNPDDAAGRHEGIFSSSFYRIEVASGNICLRVNESYTRVEGIQATLSSASFFSVFHIEDSTTVGGVQFIACLGKSTNSNHLGAFAYAAPSGTMPAPNMAINCVAWLTHASNYGFYFRTNTSGVHSYVLNCTTYGGSYGARSRSSAGTCYFYNFVSVNASTSAILETAAAGGSHVAFDIGTDPLTSGVDISGSSDAQIFTDAANGNFSLPSGSPLIDVGTDRSADGYSDDIIGTARSVWDIGAWEYASAGGAVPHAPFGLMLRGPFGRVVG